jgi:hypothetical protein
LELLAQSQQIAHAACGFSGYNVRVTTCALHLQDRAPSAGDFVISTKGIFGYTRLAWRCSNSSCISRTDATHSHRLCRVSHIIGRSRQFAGSDVIECLIPAQTFLVKGFAVCNETIERDAAAGSFRCFHQRG